MFLDLFLFLISAALMQINKVKELTQELDHKLLSVLVKGYFVMCANLHL